MVLCHTAIMIITVLPKAIVVVGLGELLSQRISIAFSSALGATLEVFFNLPSY